MNEWDRFYSIAFRTLSVVGKPFISQNLHEYDNFKSNEEINLVEINILVKQFYSEAGKIEEANWMKS